MLNLKILTEDHKGLWVQYKPSFGTPEKGILKSWNHLNCFVVFKCGGDWQHYENYTGQSVNPNDLSFCTPGGA